MRKQENDLLKKIIGEELQSMINDGTLDEGVLDVMGAKIAGGWSKGFSGDETRSTAKKVQRIIKTHRKEMQKDFASLDITAKQVDAVDQVLSGMASVEDAAEEYVHGKKAPSQRTTPAPTPQAATGGGEYRFDKETPEEPERFRREPAPTSAAEPRVPQQRASQPGINVFSGRGGKGLRSTLDKLRIDPKVSNIVLRAVADQLKSQGINVLEQKGGAKPKPKPKISAPGPADMLAVQDPPPRPPGRGKARHPGQQAAAAPKPEEGGEPPPPVGGVAATAPDAGAGGGHHLLKALKRATSLQQYGKLYKRISTTTGKPEQWDEMMKMLQGGKDPMKVAGYISRFGAPNGGEGHRAKFVELAKAEGSTAAGAQEPPTTPAATSGTIAIRGKGGLESQLVKAGLQGKDLDQALKAISAWGQAQGLQIKENALLQYISDELLVEARYDRWSALSGANILKG